MGAQPWPEATNWYSKPIPIHRRAPLQWRPGWTCRPRQSGRDSSMAPLRHLPARCPIGRRHVPSRCSARLGAPPLMSNGPVDDVACALSRSQVSGLFRALDPALTNAVFDGIWHRAGDTDRRACHNPDGVPVAHAVRGALGAARRRNRPTRTAELTAFTSGPAHRARVVDLAGMDGATLADLARTDVGYRYALAQLDSVALVGNRAPVRWRQRRQSPRPLRSGHR